MVDDDLQPLADVRVRVMPKRDFLHSAVAYPIALRETKTDGEGRFSLEDLPGPNAAVLLMGGARPHFEREIAVDQEVEIVFSGYAVIRGRVVDGKTGEPVPRFNIKLDGGSFAAERVVPGESFTSADGKFLLRDLDRNSKPTLFVEAEGYAPAQVKDVAPIADQDKDEVLVSLDRGRAVEGIVVAAERNAPLAGVQVAFLAETRIHDDPCGFLSADDWDRYWGFLEFRRTATAADGSFQFLESEAELGTLLVRAPGRRRLCIKPADRSAFRIADGRLRIPLARGERLRGVCWDDAKPVPNTEIVIERIGDGRAKPGILGGVKTGIAGEFTFEDLEPGPHLVRFEREVEEGKRRFPVVVRRRVDVLEGEEGVVELGRSLGAVTCRGRVTGLETLETLWAEISLRAEGEADEIVLKTYREWEWRFRCPFLKAGKYAVSVEFYGREGNPRVALPELEIAGDAEIDLAVPPLTETSTKER